MFFLEVALSFSCTNYIKIVLICKVKNCTPQPAVKLNEINPLNPLLTRFSEKSVPYLRIGVQIRLLNCTTSKG